MKIAILGSSGFTGEELVKIFSKHQKAEIVYTATSQKSEGNLDEVQVVLLALTPEQSVKLVPGFLEKGIKVIDLSSAYRLDREAVYGLPEKNREAIKNAKIIANPGCYPTAIVLGLWPLVKSNFISPTTKIVVKVTSGYTGAGREYIKKVGIPKSITPYDCEGGRQHKHIPEIERELNLKNQLFFYPQIAPWPRGILAVIRVRLLVQIDVFNLYKEFYKREFFVRVKSKVSIDEVIETNFCDICLSMNRDWLTVMVVIDNLGKGAVGQAVQNFNILCGFPEKDIY